jgi:DNA-binding MarR family transcriptional regulator
MACGRRRENPGSKADPIFAPHSVGTPRAGPPRIPRRAIRSLRMQAPAGEPPEYPESLLRYPTAAMFLFMREVFRLAQQRSAEARDPVEQMRFPHFAILTCLEEFGPASQREISERLRLDPSDLVGFVDWLESAGFVERRRDERDRRRYAVELTAAGRKARGLVARRTERTNDELLAGLNPEEREQLRELVASGAAGPGGSGPVRGSPASNQKGDHLRACR